jgi:hypothetical protein
MSIRMSKPWRPLTQDEVQRLPGQLGIYQIGDAGGEVLFIGMAGGRSLFGLRGELERECQQRGDAGAGLGFRVEVTMSYLTRYQELLMVFQADHGRLPAENEGTTSVSLGRLSPA